MTFGAPEKDPKIFAFWHQPSSTNIARGNARKPITRFDKPFKLLGMENIPLSHQGPSVSIMFHWGIWRPCFNGLVVLLVVGMFGVEGEVVWVVERCFLAFSRALTPKHAGSLEYILLGSGVCFSAQGFLGRYHTHALLVRILKAISKPNK